MKKAFYFTALSVLLSAATLFAQAPSWAWEKPINSDNYDQAKSIKTDAVGNVYVTGFFQSNSITFGSTTLYNYNGGTHDVYLTKYDPSGNVLWAVSAGGNQSDDANSLSIDSAGNVLIAGYFNSSSIVFGSTTLTNTGTARHFFIAKYDPSGNVLWAKGAGDATASAISCDTHGNTYMTGSFSSDNITFGSTTLTNYNTAGSNDPECFLVKYDFSGNVQWVKTIYGSTATAGTSLSNDAAGNVYIGGTASGTYVVIEGTTYASNSLFIVKYDPTGTATWVKALGGNDHSESISGLGNDAAGNLTATGVFGYTISLGTVTLNSAYSGYRDTFIAKFNTASGNAMWAKKASAYYNDYSTGMSVDAAGNEYITGYFEGASMDFSGTTILNTYTGTSTGTTDIYIAKYDSNGSVQWVKSIQGDDDDQGAAVSVDMTGNIYVAGNFKSDTLSFSGTGMTRTGSIGDAFIAKLSSGVTTGITEINQETSAIVFPNPSNGNFTIVLQATTTGISIINTLGQTIQQVNTEGKKEMNIELYEPGIYFVQLTSKNQTITKKVMVSK